VQLEAADRRGNKQTPDSYFARAYLAKFVSRSAAFGARFAAVGWRNAASNMRYKARGTLID